MKFLFPNPEHKHQALLFNERFLRGNEIGQDDQFIPIGENIEVEDEEDHQNDLSYPEERRSYNSHDTEEAASSNDRRNVNPINHNGPKMNLSLPIRQQNVDIDGSEVNRGKKVPALPTLSFDTRNNAIPQPDPDRNMEPASHSSEREQEKSESFEHSQNGSGSSPRYYDNNDSQNDQRNKGKEKFMLVLPDKKETNEIKNFADIDEVIY